MDQGQDRGWRVVEATFEQSATGVLDGPAPGLPEVAFAGRSNVGKSSLLNALTGQNALARVGRTPGRTQLLNFFRLRLRRGQEDRALRVVDLPGYGYAATPRRVSATFAPMIASYLQGRDVLKAVAVLMDARRGVDERDLGLMEVLSARQIPSLLVVTKVDKLGPSRRGLLARQVASAVGARPCDVLMTSASADLGIGDDGRDGGLVAELAHLAGSGP